MARIPCILWGSGHHPLDERSGENITDVEERPSTGVLRCVTKDREVVEYALRGRRPDPEGKQEPLAMAFDATSCTPDEFANRIKSAGEPRRRADYQPRVDRPGARPEPGG